MAQRNKLEIMGLAARAGACVAGEEKCLLAVRSGKAFLMIVEQAASANTRKRFEDKCSHYQVPLAIWATQDRLGDAIGRPGARVVAVIREDFAALLKE